MDRELPDNEGADVERHVQACSECQRRVDAYAEVSRAFVAHWDAAMELTTRRRVPRWVPVLASAAATAAALFLVLQPKSVEIPVRPPVADASSAIVLEIAPKPIKRVHRRHGIAPVKAPNANWALPEPVLQIAIPVEAMFPPGAVPEGITFVAEVSMAADGSVQGLRLQP